MSGTASRLGYSWTNVLTIRCQMYVVDYKQLSFFSELWTQKIHMKTPIPQQLTCSVCKCLKPAREFRQLLSLAHTQSMRPTAKRPIGVMRKVCASCRRKKLLSQTPQKIQDAMLKGWLGPIEGQIALAQKKAARRAQAVERHDKYRKLFIRRVNDLIQTTRKRHRQNVGGRAHYWEMMDSMLTHARDEMLSGVRPYPNVYGKPDADPLYVLTYAERMKLRAGEEADK